MVSRIGKNEDNDMIKDNKALEVEQIVTDIIFTVKNFNGNSDTYYNCQAYLVEGDSDTFEVVVEKRTVLRTASDKLVYKTDSHGGLDKEQAIKVNNSSILTYIHNYLFGSDTPIIRGF